jgi:hypothetical protein
VRHACDVRRLGRLSDQPELLHQAELIHNVPVRHPIVSHGVDVGAGYGEVSAGGRNAHQHGAVCSGGGLSHDRPVAFGDVPVQTRVGITPKPLMQSLPGHPDGLRHRTR